MKSPRTGEPFGVLAEFADGQALLDAIRRGKAAGYTRMEAYTPLPMHEVSHALGHENDLPKLVLAGGAVGAIVGFGMQYYASVIHYPINVGGRPLNSWPAFIPVTFELTILCASLAAVFGMLAMNGLPRPHHPLFAMPGFDLATRDRFFLCIESRDPRYDPQRTRDFLAGLGPHTPREVPL